MSPVQSGRRQEGFRNPIRQR